ncbi:MAG TPA: DUF268 domain-containing protein, partial [Thermoanaerobaculia bacterium]
MRLKRLKRRLRPLRDPYFLFARFLFDPLHMMRSSFNRVRSFPYFFRNLRRYSAQEPEPSLRFRFGSAWFTSFDRFAPAAEPAFHYFYQDLWAAELIHQRRPARHVDVGSRLDGFIAHVLTFCDVEYVDLRPLNVEWPRFFYRQGSATNLPYDDGSVDSLSSLHVIEHIGLGRYGDEVDARGHERAANDLTRVLAPGGTLLVGTPIGREKLAFDAHRIFDPATVRNMFATLELVSFSLVR